MNFLNLLLALLIPCSLLGQNEMLQSFENKTNTFLSTNVINGFVDYASISKADAELKALIMQITEIDLSESTENEKQAFYINSYNLLVIDQVIENYPTVSVKDIPGFFDRTKYNVAGKGLTLNEIEKDILLEEYKDSRFHFVLVCGAKDCPKLWNQAFTSINLEEQLNARTTKTLNDPTFVKETEKGFGLSEIFRWNRFEFGGKKELINFINTYRTAHIDHKSKTYYYKYDWTLNDIKYQNNSSYSSANNSFRYVTSAAIPKGGVEIKVFNNLYTQKEGNGQSLDKRSTYYTSSLSFLYGQSNRFNIGFTTRYRRVRNSSLPSSALDVFQSYDDLNGASGITAFGPQIRWAPVERWSNFSIQSSLTFPIGTGRIDGPFLDWNGPVFWTQFFNDKSIGDKFSLFTEIDLLIEEIGGSGKSNRVSTPVTAIFSWFPIKNLTIYGLAGYSPYIVSPYDYFTQIGAGTKYQLSRNFEIELLVTDFSNKYLNSINGQAATYNIGFRYSR